MAEKYGKLSIRGLGLAMGITWGFLYLFAANSSLFNISGGNPFVFGQGTIHLISSTAVEFLTGLVVAVVLGLIGGALFAWIYNRLA